MAAPVVTNPGRNMPLPVTEGMYFLARNTALKQVVQVKVPMRLLKEVYGVPASAIAGKQSKVLVANVDVVIHVDGVIVPGVVQADIRGRPGSDAYLTTRDHGHTAKSPFVAYRGHTLTGVGKEVDANVLHVYFRSGAAAPTAGSKRPREQDGPDGGPAASASVSDDDGDAAAAAAAAAAEEEDDGFSDEFDNGKRHRRHHSSIGSPQARRRSLQSLEEPLFAAAAAATAGGSEEEAADDTPPAKRQRRRQHAQPAAAAACAALDAAADAAAAVSGGLPEARSLQAMHAALLRVLPGELEGGLAPAQEDSITAAFAAAAAAAAGDDGDGGAAPAAAAAAVTAAQLEVLYGWLQLWCARGSDTLLAATVEQVVRLGERAAAARQQQQHPEASPEQEQRHQQSPRTAGKRSPRAQQQPQQQPRRQRPSRAASAGRSPS